MPRAMKRDNHTQGRGAAAPFASSGKRRAFDRSQVSRGFRMRRDADEMGRPTEEDHSPEWHREMGPDVDLLWPMPIPAISRPRHRSKAINEANGMVHFEEAIPYWGDGEQTRTVTQSA